MPILINDNTARVQYTATAGQTVFIVPYEFFEVGDLKVYNGDTLLTYNVSPSSASQYSVTGAGVTNGGSITLGAPGAALSSIITIVRDIPIKRITDFPNAGPFNIQALNAELDKLTVVQQNLETDLDNRVLRLGDSDTPNTLSAIPNKAARQNKLLGFDVQGQPVAYDSASLATLVAYATAYADTFTGDGIDTTFTLSGNPAVIANLDVSINGVTQVPFTDYTLSGTTLTTTTAVPNGAVMLVKYKEGLPNYSGDAQDIRYTASFSGAVQQSVEAKLDQTVSVKDFGAKGDGVTNDSAAFAAARLVTKKYFIPSGTYILNASPDPFLDTFIADSNVTLTVGGTSYNCSNAFAGALRYVTASAQKTNIVHSKTGNTIQYWQDGSPGTATGFFRGLAFTTDSHFIQCQPATNGGSTDLLFQRSTLNADPGGNRFNETFEESSDRLIFSYATTASGAPNFDSYFRVTAGTSPVLEFPGLQPRFSQGWKVTTRTDGNFQFVAQPTADRVHFQDVAGVLRHMTFKNDGAVGFFGAGGVTRPTITGSRGGNAALASLLTALSQLGLVTDNTTV